MRELQAIIAFSGFIALLLWGVHMVQTGVQRAFGKALGRWMGRAMGSPGRAFGTGLLVTAAIQSSTATGLMITGFAMDGLLALPAGLWAMLGANVGTTLIVQVLSFNPSFLAPGFVLVGVWMFRHHTPGRTRDLGRVFIGLGLLLLALHELVSIFAPIQDTPLLASVLQRLGDAPMLALLASTLLTWASHSSVAVVILIMSLTHHGLASPELAFALVLGANLGTAINPVLEGGGAGNPAARRLPVGNLGTRIAGCAVGLALLPWSAAIMHALGSDPAHAVANFHLLFNVVVALCFAPLVGPYARLLTRWLPQRHDPHDPARPLYLDEGAREVPAVVLSQAAREALRLSDLLRESLRLAQRALQRDDRAARTEAHRVNDAIGQLDQAITTYLAVQDEEGLSTEDQRHRAAILSFSMHLAHAASIADLGLLAHAARLHKAHWTLDEAQRSELDAVLERVLRNLSQATALFLSQDREGARRLAGEKAAFRVLEARAAERHLQRIKAGRMDAADPGAFHLDVLRDLGTINSHLVSAAAYPILERAGELRPDRLREEPAD